MGQLSIYFGVAIEVLALLLIPLVVLRRKEPSSTAAWILALVFLPVVGATLFLLFGRERVRLPAQWKRDADRALELRQRARPSWQPVAAPASATPADGEPVEREIFRIASALGGAEPTAGNAVDLLLDGDATYEAIGRAIDEAKLQVHAEYYLIRSDGTADWFRDRLVAAARRGVEVKLLVDGYGSFWIKKRWLRSLRQAGVEVQVFLPARMVLFQPMNLRNHRKIVIVDGEVAFSGGINIGDEYKGKFGPWRDAHMAIRGPAVAQLGAVFVQDWHFATGQVPPRRLPPEALAEERVEANGASVPGATVAIVRSGPDIEGSPRETIHRVFFSAITLAKHRVYITTPYFIPDRSIVVALQTAALRGVVVRLLFPSKSNHKLVFQAGRSFYEELLEAGVEIYEYGPGMIHAKTMVVDGRVALVGSANMDLRSFRLNFEVHAVVRDPAVAAELERVFEADVDVSERIDADRFRGRSRASKVLEGAARLLSPLM